MRDDFEDKADKWLNAVLYVLLPPIRLVGWIFKLIWKVLTDLFSGVYKKIISFAVVVIVVLLVVYFAKMTNQSWMNYLRY